MSDWYNIENIDQLDTPALVIYPDRIKENIRILKTFVPEVHRLRPHIKTNKCAEVCKMIMDEGIYKFKCATIAEAELLALSEAPDVLISMQLIGPNITRLVELVNHYPKTSFSSLLDDAQAASELSLHYKGSKAGVYVDLNMGMNRTGISTDKAFDLIQEIQTF